MATYPLDRTEPSVPIGPPGTRPLPGFPGYFVYRDGNITSKRYPDRLLKGAAATPFGHRKVTLRAPSGQANMWVHRAVLLAWVGPPGSGQVARHLNGDASDNRLENLAWGTPRENQQDRVAHKTDEIGERNPAAKLTDDAVREMRRMYAEGGWTYRSIAPVFGVFWGTAGAAIAGRSWSHL